MRQGIGTQQRAQHGCLPATWRAQRGNQQLRLRTAGRGLRRLQCGRQLLQLAALRGVSGRPVLELALAAA